MIAPNGGLFSGIGGWVNLSGDSQDEAVQERKVAQFASVKFGESRASALLQLREAIEDGLDFRRNRGAVDRNQRRTYVDGAGRADLAALSDVGSRRLPLVVRANRAADIEALLRLRKELNIKLVIAGGRGSLDARR